MWQISGACFLGWSLGSNDAANVFGTAVSSKMIKYSTAVLLSSFFIILGAWMHGHEGINTYSRLQSQNLVTAFITSVSAAIIVTFMTYLKLPVSTSHAVVGGIIGVGLGNLAFKNVFDLKFSNLLKIVMCWVGTPIGAAVIAVILYLIIGKFFNMWSPGIIVRDITIKALLVIAGSYGAYALGANNLANVSGPFFGEGMLSLDQAILLGSVSIVVGVLTYSRNVMDTVGKNIVPLDPFTALIAILAEAVTVHFYALVGVPVSTSHAIVGAILGIGLIKGSKTINRKTLLFIAIGWITTPVCACILSFLAMTVYCTIVK